MKSKRLRRLQTFEYTGQQRYSLTFCTHERRALFTDAALARCVAAHILQTAASVEYEAVVYCVMPDHMHLLVTGRPGSAPLPVFVQRAKQLSGYHGGRLAAHRVWQTGYYERVLREAEDTRELTAYILNNPVRAGLVKNAADYEFIGSSVYTLMELLEFIQLEEHRNGSPSR